MLHAYNMFDINVTGLQLRTVSTTYTTTVGKLAAFQQLRTNKVSFSCNSLINVLIIVSVSYYLLDTFL